MAYLNTTTSAGNALAASAASILQGVVTGFKQYRVYRETLDGLSALSDRDLADLGLHRCDLTRIARESAQNAKV